MMGRSGKNMPNIEEVSSVPGNTYGATMAYQTARFWLLAKLSEENCMTTILDVTENIRYIVEDEKRFFDEMRRFGG